MQSSRSSFSRPAARSAALAALLATAVVGALVTTAQAADPEGGTVSSSQTEVTWQGEMFVGAAVMGPEECPPDEDPDNETCDHFALTVPEEGDVGVEITWTNPADDFDLYVYNNAGEEVGSSAGFGEGREALTLAGVSGDFEVRVVPFAVTASDYDGTATYATPDPTTNVTPDGRDGLRAADAQGLEFSATVAADNQRDESEPIILIDDDGTTYGCGPSGAGSFEFAQVSTDGGDQFHLLGEPPIGSMTAGAGGDCQIAVGTERNDAGFYDYAYVGLQPLTNFSVATSPDAGRTINRSVPFSTSIPGVDRQWGSFVSQDRTLLSYNQQAPRQIVVQASDDDGETYGVRVPASQVQPSFPGPMRTLPKELFGADTDSDFDIPYFPWNDGNQINLSLSLNGGDNWLQCRVASSLGDPTLFVTADHDSAGTIYVAYGEGASFHTFMTSISAENLTDCNEPVSTVAGQQGPPQTNPGFTTPVQVDRGDIRTTVFPWIAAGGEPGRVAVTFYGTNSEGDPNSGEFKATWDVYVNQSLNADAASPTFSQVKATTHPFHYDSICLEGLGCSVSGGDRSLADFFAMDYNPDTGALMVIYDQGSKAPDEPAGQIATPAVVRQIAGPSIGGGTVDLDRDTLRSSSLDPLEDALADYSSIGDEGRRVNAPAADFTSHTVSQEIDLETGEVVEDGGFTVVFTLDDLSDEALTQAMSATQSQSLLWIFRFVDGYRASAAGAAYDGTSFSFGYNEYTTGDNNDPNNPELCFDCVQYPLDTEIQGEVDQEAGTITLSVPADLLSALSPQGTTLADGERPDEVPVEDGSRIYDATAFSLGNTQSTTQDQQGYLYPLDNTPAMDFLIGPLGTPGPGEGDVLIRRDAGDTRIDTSVALSQDGFESADTVVLARADLFPDALASTTLAKEVSGPVLLSGSDGLDPRVATELERLGVSRAYLAGGTAALSEQVEQDLTDAGIEPERLNGASRYETAALVADEVVEIGGPVTQTIIARADDFADALSAGNLATTSRAPILLTDTDELNERTATALEDLAADELTYIAGGTAAVSQQVQDTLAEEGHTVKRLAGPERYATAVVIAEEAQDAGAGQTPVVLATGDDFPDALSAVGMASQKGGILLLVHPTDLDSSSATRDYLDERTDLITEIIVAGGPAAVSDGVLAQIRILFGVD